MKFFTAIILTAFLCNSTALFYFDFENIKDIFTSTIDFSLTIAPRLGEGSSSGSGVPPAERGGSGVPSGVSVKQPTPKQEPSKAPLEIKLVKRKIRKGKKLPIEIKPRLDEMQKLEKTAPKKINLRIKTKNRVPSEEKNIVIEILDSNKTERRQIPITENLLEGIYIAEASYLSGNNLFAFSTEFEVLPKPPILITLLRWNEGGLATLLIMPFAVTAVRRFRGRRVVRRGHK